MPVVPTLDVEKYLDFKGMTHYLKAVSSAAPHLVRAFSIGKSKAGRPLLVAEVTNRNLGEGRQKPGIWVDGGHQGWNLLGSIASLELLRFLVAGHGRDEFLTDLVDHTVFYIAPRLAPDEMELCLKSGALIPQPGASEKPLSLSGRQFRSETPLGGWKPFKRDNRVLIPRNPEDRKGPFYDLHRHLEGDQVLQAGPNDFPSPQAAEMPLQLPSTRAVFEFMRSYTNVFGVISTSGPGDRLQLIGDHSKGPIIGQLGRRLSELAGLPFAPVQQSEDNQGQFLAWASQTLGLLAADCQMWSLRSAAGLQNDELENPLSADETEILQLMRFCEKEFPEGSFADWTEVDDPVWGKGEVGGWDWSRTWLNPPSGPYLARELKKLSRLALGLAAASPRLSLANVQETVVGWSTDKQPLRLIHVVVENQGYMPTCPVGTGKQLDGRVTLKLGDNVLLIGETSTPLGELGGIGSRQPDNSLGSAQKPTGLPTQRVLKADYLVKGSEPLEITVSHPMAGTESITTRPPQGLRPPSFDSSAMAPPTTEAAPATEDPFDEVFPSFEELYSEPSPPPEPPPPVRKPEPRPPEPVVPQEPVRPSREEHISSSSLSSEFNIPDPPSQPMEARPVKFASLDSPSSQAKSPFPSKPSKGRVFGTPPQKSAGALPLGLGGLGEEKSPPPKPEKSKQEGEFSPLPLVKSEGAGSAFEPLIPKADSDDIFGSETFGGSGSASAPTDLPPFEEQRPSTPPARLTRSTPKLLRRQRGGQDPHEPFKRS